jgi:hypothetical protein
MPGETPIRWTARIPSMRSSEKYCRVEIEGAHIEDEPIALVKEARLAVVIAALPLLAEALRSCRSELRNYERTEMGTPNSSALNAIDEADAALAAMEGR